MIAVFLNKILTVFFALVSPASSAANPRCIMKTRIVDINIQVLLIVKSGVVTFKTYFIGKTMPSLYDDSMI